MHNLISGRSRVSRTSRAATNLGIGLTLLTLAGCDLINPDEQVPAYLSIAPYVYSPGTDGPPTANPASSFIYVDNQLLGVFDLPAKVPVLRAGEVSVRLVPAIYPDGQRGTRVVYPFYTDYAFKPTITPGQTLRVMPPVTYSTVARLPFEISENFDQSTSTSFTVSAVPSAPYVLESGVDLNGQKVGRVQGIPGKNDVFFLESVWEDPLPNRGAPVYLELDYRTTMPFQVGVKYNNGFVSDLTVYPNSEWTKLYVNLTDEVSRFNNDMAEFKIYFQGFPTGSAGDFFAFDNVRLIRPQ